jgi:3-oxoacyl-[acyl-carrier protein] reductase
MHKQNNGQWACAGCYKTAMNEKTAPEQLAYMTAKIPMGRLGTIEEVASLSC